MIDRNKLEMARRMNLALFCGDGSALVRIVAEAVRNGSMTIDEKALSVLEAAVREARGEAGRSGHVDP